MKQEYINIVLAIVLSVAISLTAGSFLFKSDDQKVVVWAGTDAERELTIHEATVELVEFAQSQIIRELQQRELSSIE